MPLPDLPPSWARALADEIAKPSFRELDDFVAAERAEGQVYPPNEATFRAFELTPFDEVNVVLLGQDPYHGPGQAHGLALSVMPGVPIPPSLANMFKELATDRGCRVPDNGCLEPWARQGVLLLNAVLTVRDGAAGSHANRGWEAFTDAVIRALGARERPVVFALWGGHARKKARLIDASRHRVLECAHPSPLSAHAGFFGARPFSAIDDALRSLGRPPIDWQLPDLGVPVIKSRKGKASGNAPAQS
jgi:uracil-DNA glycosylase